MHFSGGELLVELAARVVALGGLRLRHADVVGANERALAVNVLLDALAAADEGEVVDVAVARVLAHELGLLVEEEEGVVAEGLVVGGIDGDEGRPGRDEHDGVAGLGIDDPFLDKGLLSSAEGGSGHGGSGGDWLGSERLRSLVGVSRDVKNDCLGHR